MIFVFGVYSMYTIHMISENVLQLLDLKGDVVCGLTESEI